MSPLGDENKSSAEKQSSIDVELLGGTEELKLRELRKMAAEIAESNERHTLSAIDSLDGERSIEDQMVAWNSFQVALVTPIFKLRRQGVKQEWLKLYGVDSLDDLILESPYSLTSVFYKAGIELTGPQKAAYTKFDDFHYHTVGEVANETLTPEFRERIKEASQGVPLNQLRTSYENNKGWYIAAGITGGLILSVVAGRALKNRWQAKKEAAQAAIATRQESPSLKPYAKAMGVGALGAMAMFMAFNASKIKVWFGKVEWVKGLKAIVGAKEATDEAKEWAKGELEKAEEVADEQLDKAKEAYEKMLGEVDKMGKDWDKMTDQHLEVKQNQWEEKFGKKEAKAMIDEVRARKARKETTPEQVQAKVQEWSETLDPETAVKMMEEIESKKNWQEELTGAAAVAAGVVGAVVGGVMGDEENLTIEDVEGQEFTLEDLEKQWKESEKFTEPQVEAMVKVAKGLLKLEEGQEPNVENIRKGLSTFADSEERLDEMMMALDLQEIWKYQLEGVTKGLEDEVRMAANELIGKNWDDMTEEEKQIKEADWKVGLGENQAIALVNELNLIEGGKKMNPEETGKLYKHWREEFGRSTALAMLFEIRKVDSWRGEVRKVADKIDQEIEQLRKSVDLEKGKVELLLDVFWSVAFLEPEYRADNVDKRGKIAIRMLLNNDKITVHQLDQLLADHHSRGEIPLSALGLENMPTINPNSRMTQEAQLFNIIQRLSYFCKITVVDENTTLNQAFEKIANNPIYRLNRLFTQNLVKNLKPGNFVGTFTDLDYKGLETSGEQYFGDFLDTINQTMYAPSEIEMLNGLSEQERTDLRVIQVYLLKNAVLDCTADDAVDLAIKSILNNQGREINESSDSKPRKLAIAFLTNMQNKTRNLINEVHKRWSLEKAFPGKYDSLKKGLDYKKISFRHAVELNLAVQGVDWKGGEGNDHWMKDLAVLQVVLRSMESGPRNVYIGQLYNVFTRKNGVDVEIPGVEGIYPYLTNVMGLMGRISGAWLLRGLQFLDNEEQLPSFDPNFMDQLRNAPLATLFHEAVGGVLEMPTDSIAVLFATLNRAGVPLEDLLGMQTYDDFIEILGTKGLNTKIEYDMDRPGLLAIRLGGYYFFGKPKQIFENTLQELWKVGEDDEQNHLTGAVAAWIGSSIPFIVLRAGKGFVWTLGRIKGETGTVERSFRDVFRATKSGAWEGAFYAFHAPKYAIKKGKNFISFLGDVGRFGIRAFKAPIEAWADAKSFWHNLTTHSVFQRKNPRRILKIASSAKVKYARYRSAPAIKEGLSELWDATWQTIRTPIASGQEFLTDPWKFLEDNFSAARNKLVAGAREGIWGVIDEAQLQEEVRNLGLEMERYLEPGKGELPYSLIKAESGLSRETIDEIFKLEERLEGLAEKMTEPEFAKKVNEASVIPDAAKRVEAMKSLFKKAGLLEGEAKALARQFGAGKKVKFALAKVNDLSDQWLIESVKPTNPIEHVSVERPSRKLTDLETTKIGDGIKTNETRIKNVEESIEKAQDKIIDARTKSAKHKENSAEWKNQDRIIREQSNHIAALEAQKARLAQQNKAQAAYRDAITEERDLEKMSRAYEELEEARRINIQQLEAARKTKLDKGKPLENIDELESTQEELNRMFLEVHADVVKMHTAVSSAALQEKINLTNLDEKLVNNEARVEELDRKIALEQAEMDKIPNEEGKLIYKRRIAHLEAQKAQILVESAQITEFKAVLKNYYTQRAELKKTIQELDQFLLERDDVLGGARKAGKSRKEIRAIEEAFDQAQRAKADIQKLLQKTKEARAHAQVKARKNLGKATEFWVKEQNTIGFKANQVGKGIKRPTGLGKALTILGGAFSAYQAYQEFGKAFDSARFGNWELAGIDAQSGAMYGVETMALAGNFAKRAAVVRMAQGLDSALIPLTYVVGERLKYKREKKMTSADWVKAYGPTHLLDQLYTTSISGGIGEAFAMRRRAKKNYDKFYHLTNEELLSSDAFREAMDENQRQGALVMYSIFEALIGLSNGTEVIEALNDKKGVNQVNEIIKSKATPYHKYFFWHADLTQLSNQVAARKMIHDANQFSKAMTEIQEARKKNKGTIEKRKEAIATLKASLSYELLTEKTKGEITQRIKGLNTLMYNGINLMDERYETFEKKREFFGSELVSGSNFDPMEVVRAYENDHEEGLRQALPENVQSNIKNLPTSYLLYVFSKNNQLLHQGNLNEAEKEKIGLYQFALSHELEKNRDVILNLEAGRADFFAQAPEKQQVLYHINGLEAEHSEAFENFEKMNIRTNAGVNSLYKAARLLGYQGFETEKGLREFFAKGKEDYNGIYWDPTFELWKVQEAGVEKDHDMGDSLNGLTAKNMIEFIKANKDDIMKSRRADMIDLTGSKGFEMQLDLMIREMEKGLKEGDAAWWKAIRVESGLTGDEAIKRYGQVIDEGVRSIYTMEHLRYSIKNDSEIEVWRQGKKGARTIEKHADGSWKIEGVHYSEEKLNLAQAVVMADILNSMEDRNVSDILINAYNKSKPFYVTSSWPNNGAIAINTERTQFTERHPEKVIEVEVIMSDVEFGAAWDVNLSRQQVVDILNKWHEIESNKGLTESILESLEPLREAA